MKLHKNFKYSLLFLLLVVWGIHLTATAGEIWVTTSADTVDANDGVTSLREAINAAATAVANGGGFTPYLLPHRLPEAP